MSYHEPLPTSVGNSVPRPLQTAAPAVQWIGRALLSAIFLASGLAKLAGWSGTVAMMAGKGMPVAPLLAAAAIAVEVGGGLLLLSGLRTGGAYRWGALVLALFLVPATFLFHNFWAFTGDAQRMHQIHFLKNLAIMGGLLHVAVAPSIAAAPAIAPATRRRAAA